MTNCEKYFAEQIKNEEFHKEYEAIEPELYSNIETLSKLVAVSDFITA